jgi:chromosome partitioning protein
MAGLSVLVGNIKGGCGKTTVATHVASHFAKSGLSTAIGDCDIQRSSLNWLARRSDTRPAIQGLDWAKDVGKPPKGLDRLVIDAPAAMHHKDVEALIDLADIILVPVLPGAFDEDASAHFLKRVGKVKAVRKNKRVVAVIGNRLRPGTRASDHLDRFFSGLGFPVIARLRDAQVYPQAAAAGSSILEMRGARVAAHQQDWEPILELLQG